MLYSELDQWYQSVLGESIFTLEKQYIDKILPNIYGRELCLPASVFQERWTEKSPIYRHTTLGVSSSAHRTHPPTVFAEFTALPLLDNTQDVVILPHVLELQSAPKAVLNEFCRVLKPEGYLILFGFNPMSFCGIRRFFHYSSKKTFPWMLSFISLNRMIRWLSEFNFDVLRKDSLFYRPPIDHPAFLKSLGFLETFSGCSWFYFGGVYCMIAQKREFAVTPLKVSWQVKKEMIVDRRFEPARRSQIGF